MALSAKIVPEFCYNRVYVTTEEVSMTGVFFKGL